jgi:hypothetical protein
VSASGSCRQVVAAGASATRYPEALVREVYSAGIIPVSLIRWQFTGKDEEVRAIVAKE